MMIRRAREEDVEVLQMLLERNMKEIMVQAHSAEVLSRYLSHNTTESWRGQLQWKKVYVAEDESGIVGTGAFANFGTEDTPRHSISNLYVLPERHGKGIGTILFRALLANAVEVSAKSFHVPSSRNAVSFYQKLGFTVDAEQADTADEITWMTLLL